MDNPRTTFRAEAPSSIGLQLARAAVGGDRPDREGREVRAAGLAAVATMAKSRTDRVAAYSEADLAADAAALSSDHQFVLRVGPQRRTGGNCSPVPFVGLSRLAHVSTSAADASRLVCAVRPGRRGPACETRHRPACAQPQTASSASARACSGEAAREPRSRVAWRRNRRSTGSQSKLGPRSR